MKFRILGVFLILALQGGRGVQLMRIVWRETIGHYKFGNSQELMSMNGFEEILMQFLKLMVIIDTFISMGQSPYRGGYA